VTCPICARETDPKYRPFCSRRCADVDLGRWVTGAYVLPAEPADDQQDDADAPRPLPPDRPQ
jgi:endogenous inhibitor of DNA gyrase (YacG/DUF329 family)